MKRSWMIVAIAAAALSGPASAFTFFSTGATTGPGPGDPGLQSFETSLVTFDGPLHSGITDTVSGTVGLFTGTTSGVAAAPVGDTSVYQAVGTGGSSTFNFDGYFAMRQVRSLSVYVGSVDLYNYIDVLDTSGNVIGTISGAQLPGNNGDQGASVTNRRLYINFAPSEHVGGLTFRSSGVAFEFDTIGASSVVFATPPAPLVAPGSPPVDPAPLTLPAVVPEPASWTLLIGGFALTGVAARRRRGGLRAA
jgi:hypothetical protein